MKYPGLMSLARVSHARMKSGPAAWLLKAVHGAASTVESDSESFEQLGQMAGLTRFEVSRATIWPNAYMSGTVGRLCARLALVVILVILLAAVTSHAGYFEPVPTYAPGSRYASVSPREFR